MITEYDLDEAIAEMQGKRHPGADDCIKLAAFLTIKRELFGRSEQPQEVPAYSYASAPVQTVGKSDTVTYSGDSEFAQAVNGKNAGEMWAIMDELMTSIAVLYPPLYNAVMRKLQE